MNYQSITTILFEDTTLRLVPHYPDNGYRFYVSNDGKIGLRIAPDGGQTLVNATPTTCINCKIQSDANRVQRYLMFKNAWGNAKHTLVSRAVYLAWSGQPIPPNHQIHHLTGIVTDNRFDNLLCVHFRKHRLVADKRQKALRTVVPDGDLYCFTYERLRELQDPDNLSDEQFQTELEAIRAKGFHKVDPEAQMNYEITHHVEFLEH